MGCRRCARTGPIDPPRGLAGRESAGPWGVAGLECRLAGYDDDGTRRDGEVFDDDEHVVEVSGSAGSIAVGAREGVELLGELLSDGDSGNDRSGHVCEAEDVTQGDLGDGSSVSGHQVDVEADPLELSAGEHCEYGEPESTGRSLALEGPGSADLEREPVTQVEKHSPIEGGFEFVAGGSPVGVGVGGRSGPVAEASEEG